MSLEVTTLTAEDQDRPQLCLEKMGRIPRLEFRYRRDGKVIYRYVVDDPKAYPGFDGCWRVMSEWERRETLRMGGTVAEWLRSLEEAV